MRFAYSLRRKPNKIEKKLERIKKQQEHEFKKIHTHSVKENDPCKMYYLLTAYEAKMEQLKDEEEDLLEIYQLEDKENLCTQIHKLKLIT